MILHVKVIYHSMSFFSLLLCGAFLPSILFVNANQKFLNANDYYYHSHHRHSYVENLKSHPHTALTTKDFMITSFSIKVLESIIDNQENDHILHYIVKQSQVQYIDTEFLSVIDEFLTPRLWLRLLHVTMHENHHLHENGTAIDPSSHSTDLVLPTVDYVIFEKAPPQLFESLEILSRKSFPSTQQECQDRPLAAHLLMGTWGNDFRQMSEYLVAFSQAIVYIFSSHTGNVSDTTSFNVKGECVDKVNKHQCLFLPTTNCKLPEELARLSFDRIPDNVFYPMADPSAQRLEITGLREFIETLQGKHKFKLPSNAPVQVHLDRYDLNQKLSYAVTGTPPYIDSEDSTTFSHRVVPRDLSLIVHYNGIALRQNTEFRLRTQKLVETFRSSTHPHFSSNVTCIWAHVRKGDRNLPDEPSMTDWCKTHTRYNAETDRFEPVGEFRRNNQTTSMETVNLSDVYDLGCQMALPYGAATLEHFLNASLLLSPTNRNIFLSTDDEPWLMKALSEYRSKPNNLITQKHLQIFRFNPHRNHRNEPSMQTAAEFFATIELGQQCEGFVGYTEGSAVAQLFYDFMCYYHHFTYLNCPPLFDFGTEYHKNRRF